MKDDFFKLFVLRQRLAGFTYQRYNRQLQYTVALVAYGALTIITPKLNGMDQFSIVNALFGVSSAFIDIATNVWILELFTMGNVNLHMQLVYFVFALGICTLNRSDP